ncbi:MAG: N6-adenosine-specific RNA methylase IME4 [Oceanospirillaceae bacterium]|jgi:N6-adenosine-specific RNA methylase IME4
MSNNKKYNIILADPPWQFSNKKTGGSMKSGAAHQYLTTGIEGLKQLDVNSIAADDAVLLMWYVGAMPQEAIDLVHAWGFTLKNMNGFVWNKLTQKNKPHFGMGFYTRAGSESVIIATKGKFKPVSHGVRAVFNADEQIQFEGKAIKHSKKPVQVRDLIVELCGDLPRLEMFARESSSGWDVFGNEAPNSIDIKKKTPTN